MHARMIHIHFYEIENNTGFIQEQVEKIMSSFNIHIQLKGTKIQYFSNKLSHEVDTLAEIIHSDNVCV